MDNPNLLPPWIKTLAPADPMMAALWMMLFFVTKSRLPLVSAMSAVLGMASLYRLLYLRNRTQHPVIAPSVV